MCCVNLHQFPFNSSRCAHDCQKARRRTPASTHPWRHLYYFPILCVHSCDSETMWIFHRGATAGKVGGQTNESRSQNTRCDTNLTRSLVVRRTLTANNADCQQRFYSISNPFDSTVSRDATLDTDGAPNICDLAARRATIAKRYHK